MTRSMAVSYDTEYGYEFYHTLPYMSDMSDVHMYSCTGKCKHWLYVGPPGCDAGRPKGVPGRAIGFSAGLPGGGAGSAFSAELSTTALSVIALSAIGLTTVSV